MLKYKIPQIVTLIRYFLQGIPTETANVYTFSVYILVYMSGIIQGKMQLYFC